MTSTRQGILESPDDLSTGRHDNDSRQYSFLSLEQQDECDKENEERLSKVEGELESTLFDDLSQENDLCTPLLAGDHFMELEPSQENVDTLIDILSKQKTLIWDRVTSNLKVRWLENSNEHESLTATANTHEAQNNNIEMNVSIAAVFLRDYESSRPCSLSPKFESITPLQLEMYNLRFSTSHQFLVYVAIGSLFLGSFFEGEFTHGIFAFTFQMLFTAFAAAIFTMDIVIRGHYDDDNLFTTNMQTLYTRKTRARRWKIPMLIMLFAVTLETTIKVLFNSETLIIWSSIFKPVVFFYVSSKARDGTLI